MSQNNNPSIREIQEKILIIVDYFDMLCKKHDIQYFLMGGSALGACRHMGFIPWDDDFDIFMTSENYFRFLDIAREEIQGNFYWQEEATDEWPLYFSKIRLNNTLFVEDSVSNRKMHHGIYIDLMCLNYVSNSGFVRRCQYFAARLLTAKTIAKRGGFEYGRIKTLAIRLLNVLVNSFIENQLINFVRYKNASKSKYVAHYFGKAKYRKAYFPSSWIGESRREIVFENRYLPVLQKVEDYLALRYGPSFMDLPSQEVKDMYPSHASHVEL